MFRINMECRILNIVNLDELGIIKNSSTDYVVLVDTRCCGVQRHYQNIFEHIICEKCAEVYFIGNFAEEAHDALDEFVEDRGMLDVITTWDSGEDFEESAFYFLQVAGSQPDLLYAITFGEDDIENALRLGSKKGIG